MRPPGDQFVATRQWHSSTRVTFTLLESVKAERPKSSEGDLGLA